MELIKSIILNKQVSDTRNYEENSGRAYFLLDVFCNNVDYTNEIKRQVDAKNN